MTFVSILLLLRSAFCLFMLFASVHGSRTPEETSSASLNNQRTMNAEIVSMNRISYTPRRYTPRHYTPRRTHTREYRSNPNQQPNHPPSVSSSPDPSPSPSPAPETGAKQLPTQYCTGRQRRCLRWARCYIRIPRPRGHSYRYHRWITNYVRHCKRKCGYKAIICLE